MTTDTLATAAAARPGVLGTFGWPIHLGLHLHLFARVEHWMHTAGYPVLFGLLFSCGVGLPLPEDVPLLFAGFFVAQGEMHLLPAAVVAWCGIILGDCCLYAIGRKYGMGVTNVPVIGRHIRKDRIEALHTQFEKYGVWVVAVGRLFAGVRGAMVLVAGTIRFTFSHFIIADGLAAIASGGLFMGLGYWGGHKLGPGGVAHLHELIEHYSTRILLVLVAVALVALPIVMWRRRAGTRRRPFAAVLAPGDAAAAPPAVPAAEPAAAADAPALPPA